MKIETIRHSLAHILASAVQELFPGTKFGIGPSIKNGFYYDFDLKKSLTPENLPKIEKKMREIIKKGISFKKKNILKREAKKIFKNQPYKLEIINELKESKMGIYESGDFKDLCQGPHIKSTKEIPIDAFKLTKIAGAYWKGSEKNQMLTRIYGIAFKNKKDLEEYSNVQKEAEKRDHRKLGEQLEIFAFSDKIGKGLPLWLPNGTIIRDELEKWAREIEEKQGYVRVKTPHITKSELYYISGHLPHYKNDMYSPFKIDGDEYYLRPMNCPHHHMIYKSSPKSYRDIPFRMAEYGTVYRYEMSGVLYGLMRTRGFCQNDAHIYCSFSQAKDEFIKVMKMSELYYKKLGINDFYMELALRDPKNPEKYHGNKKMWSLAEKMTRQAMIESKIPFKEKKGGAAFYGPKVDFIIESVTVKEYAISTNQLDLYMGKRFGLTYRDKDGKSKIPAIIHRAPLGSHERFVGFLLEHFAGAFPIWLSPVQIEVIPISEKYNKYGEKILKKLKENGIRAKISDNDETLGKKIRESAAKKTPYMLIVGKKEMKNNLVGVRERKKGDIGTMKLDKFLKKVKIEIENKK